MDDHDRVEFNAGKNVNCTHAHRLLRDSVTFWKSERARVTIQEICKVVFPTRGTCSRFHRGKWKWWTRQVWTPAPRKVFLIERRFSLPVRYRSTELIALVTLRFLLRDLVRVQLRGRSFAAGYGATSAMTMNPPVVTRGLRTGHWL